MRTLFVAVALVLGSFPHAAAGMLAPDVEAEVTRAVEDELRETGAPGAAVAIVRDGEVVYLRAFGRTSVEEDAVPVTSLGRPSARARE